MHTVSDAINDITDCCDTLGLKLILKESLAIILQKLANSTYNKVCTFKTAAVQRETL